MHVTFVPLAALHCDQLRALVRIKCNTINSLSLFLQSSQPQANRFLNASSRMSMWTEESGLGFRRVWGVPLASSASSWSVVAVSDVAGRLMFLPPLLNVRLPLSAGPSPKTMSLCNVHTPRLCPENLWTWVTHDPNNRLETLRQLPRSQQQSINLRNDRGLNHKWRHRLWNLEQMMLQSMVMIQ